MPSSLAQQYHVHNARLARASALADGTARPTRPATAADLGFAPLGVDPSELDAAVIPWRSLTRDQVVTAFTDPRPSVRSRARRALNRIDYGK